MVDGAACLASYPQYQHVNSFGNWTGRRGTNPPDGGAPFNDTYQTRSFEFMAVSPPPLSDLGSCVDKRGEIDSIEGHWNRISIEL